MSEYIYGKNTIRAYLKSGRHPLALYLFDKGSYPEIEKLALENNIKVEKVPKHQLDKWVKGIHQGVVAKVSAYQYHDLEDVVSKGNNKLIVMCDQLEDPHNLGAILRSSDAAGVDGVIVGKNRSVGLNDTVAKVSTGAVHSVPVVQVGNLVQTINTLKEKGYWIVGAENGVDAQPYTEFAVDMSLVLVVGSEGKGISRLVKESCDILTTIPMQGSVNSLNVSVATAIILFDIVRRRKEK